MKLGDEVTKKMIEDIERDLQNGTTKKVFKLLHEFTGKLMGGGEGNTPGVPYHPGTVTIAGLNLAAALLASTPDELTAGMIEVFQEMLHRAFMNKPSTPGCDCDVCKMRREHRGETKDEPELDIGGLLPKKPMLVN